MSMLQSTSNQILRQGLLFGMAAGAVGTALTILSILIPMSRWVWLRLFDITGITMFVLSFIAAIQVGRHTRSRSAAIVSSVCASLVGCLIYTVAQLVAPYALFGQLVHYPFLHEDFTNSGIPTIKQYLLSDKGYWGVVGTTVGMLQYSLPFAALLGAVLGYIGGRLALKCNVESAS